MPRRFTILFIDCEAAQYWDRFTRYVEDSGLPWHLQHVEPDDRLLAELRTAKADAVVLSVAGSGPQCPGLEVLARLRSRLPATPVIVLSPREDPRVMRDAFLSVVRTENLAIRETDPEDWLFKDSLTTEEGIQALSAAIQRGLFKYGRVPNERAVLITHGTDTMAWALAYLRYSLKDLTANVAITGSQIPLEGFFSVSDALGNLKTAVFLLNRLRPAHTFAVFGNGSKVFGSRLCKVRKWTTDAFDGLVVAHIKDDQVVCDTEEWVYIPYDDQRLHELHLIRTGGTIESRADESGALKPTADFVWRYLNDTLSGYFINPVRHDLFALDSSNMTFAEWRQVAETIESIGVAHADTRFDLSVKPVLANPAFSMNDYVRMFEESSGVVLLGYGGGNANTLRERGCSVLPAIERATSEGRMVAVMSQVPLETYDIDYEAGRALLAAGGVPCGDLSLAEAQVRLSYIQGHADILEQMASEHGLSPRLVRIAAFLSGVRMRKPSSMGLYVRMLEREGLRLRVLPEDPLVGRPFEEALKTVCEALRREPGQ